MDKCKQKAESCYENHFILHITSCAGKDIANWALDYSSVIFTQTMIGVERLIAMFRLLSREFRRRQASGSKRQTQAESNGTKARLSKNMGENLQTLRKVLGDSSDVIIRQMKINLDSDVDAAVIYIDGLVDRVLLNHDILQPLMFNLHLIEDNGSHNQVLDFLKSSVLTVGQIMQTEDIDQIIAGALSGNIAILAEGANQALLIDAKGWEKRNIEEPTNEVSIRGPRDSFTETLRTNTALIRRRIRDPRLTFKSMQIGQRSHTDVAVAYVQGITPDGIVAEIEQRLKRIDTDIILDVYYIEEFIEDNPSSLFPSVGVSERPDVVAAKILEGRAAILVDGSPTALTVPFLFAEGFQNPDDYYARSFFASLIRWVRFLGFVLSIYLPGIYVALNSFHPELFPTPLLVSVAAAREGLPFPSVVEALLMMAVFEVLREAGLRMPRSLGQAVSIVGALVIGQAAVSAGLVGAPMVIIISATAIASFLVVPYAEGGALLRLAMTAIAGFLGLFGMVIVQLEILSFMAAVRSFGVPYFSPVSPLNLRGLKDTFIRAPLWMMDSRPDFLNSPDKKRQAPGQMPGPPETEPDRGTGQ
ncbi:MAG: spore germination protein [Syntrophomonadaceae bacterium]|nr:spore germination protein [Syntrophomonadaceae bacterium]